METLADLEESLGYSGPTAEVDPNSYPTEPVGTETLFVYFVIQGQGSL
jgi:hypothetical protein